MNWLAISLQWYTALLFLGLIFFPLTKRFFGKIFFDFGYPFAKVLAILFLSYTVFILGTIKVLPFTQTNIVFLILGFFLINVFLHKKQNNSHPNPNTYRLTLIIFEELLFLIAFIFWTYVRGQEPSIRGLEKYMDFGFINSILRSKFFPPLDIWLSSDNINKLGFPINYYYFGHLTGAFLIKLTGVKPSIGYNLILATIFALATTQVFSLVLNLCYSYLVKSGKKIINLVEPAIFGMIGAFIVNLGGNLHTIYAFTSGYPNEKPIPFWQILSSYNPTKYWYPNATRFIPFTIHEFPSYSYVVADLHGHVFDIPFVLLTLAILFKLFITFKANNKLISNFKFQISKLFTNHFSLITIFLGFLTAVHYMTNAFDGPIYLLLALIVFLIIFGINQRFLWQSLILIISFIIYSLPFSLNFSPFISGIGVNCSPEFLTKVGRLGPFLFERNNCQISPAWMLFVLWGFFWVSFAIFLIINRQKKNPPSACHLTLNKFLLILFSFGTILIVIPEFFYIKDIYPAHFRANTMFKLGYQAFIMMGIASSITFFLIKHQLPSACHLTLNKFLLRLVSLFFLFFVIIYPLFSVPSYYGNLKKTPQIDGEIWLSESYPEDEEIIDFLNQKIVGQPVTLEAQGDSYTDHQRISAYTGLPTVAGWWVHEWLWRGSSDVVGKRIPDIVSIYESDDIPLTKKLIRTYQVKYIVVSKLEREKYPRLNLDKFSKIARLIFRSRNKNGLIYQVVD